MYYEVTYYPYLGFCLVICLNQAKCEWIQLKESGLKEYLSDWWNLNDLAYLVLNFTVIVMNYFDHEKHFEE